MSKQEVWERVAVEHPEFTKSCDVSGNFRAVEEIVLSGSLTWKKAHELFRPGPDKLVLDIGANAGIYSAFCAVKGADVFAFEPGLNSYTLLNKMIAETKLSNINPIKAAVGRKAGLQRTVEHRIENNGLVYFNGGLQSHGVQWTKEDFMKSEVVPVLTLDSIINFCDSQIDCVKIDVEGSEADIITGASMDTLSKIRFMYIEVHDWMGRDLYMQMLAHLRVVYSVEGYVHPGTGLFEAIYCTR